MAEYYSKLKNGTQFCVEFEGDLVEYAKNWLHLTNNARENPNAFAEIRNTSSNTVYVKCYEKYTDSVRDYLENFGKIESEAPCKIFDLEIEITQAEFNKIYKGDTDPAIVVDIY